MNDNNLEHYNKAGLLFQKDLAKQGGFDGYTDMEFVYPYLKHAGTILEVGAGFGRCIDFFLEQGFKGKLIGIERSEPFVLYLKDHFRRKDNVEIFDADIKQFKLNNKVDAVLWMWSIFIEFSQVQQYECLQKSYEMLSENGVVIIDIPKLGFKTIGNHSDDKNLVWQSPYGTLTCYIPDEKEMKNNAKKIGFRDFKSLFYKTTKEKERTVYVLTK